MGRSIALREVARQKTRVETCEQELIRERAVLKRLMRIALKEKHRKADLARAMNVTPVRVGEMLK